MAGLGELGDALSQQPLGPLLWVKRPLQILAPCKFSSMLFSLTWTSLRKRRRRGDEHGPCFLLPYLPRRSGIAFRFASSCIFVTSQAEQLRKRAASTPLPHIRCVAHFHVGAYVKLTVHILGGHDDDPSGTTAKLRSRLFVIQRAISFTSSPTV